MSDIRLRGRRSFLGSSWREIGVLPIWVCPIGRRATRTVFHFIRSRRRFVLQLRFFWDVVESPRGAHEPGHYNRLIENKVLEAGRHQVAVFDCYFDRTRLRALCDRQVPGAQGRKYDRNTARSTCTTSAYCGPEKQKTGREARFVAAETLVSYANRQKYRATRAGSGICCRDSGRRRSVPLM